MEHSIKNPDISRKLLLDVVLTELVLELLLEMLLCQFLVGVLLDQNGLLEIIHNLKNQYHFLLTPKFHSLEVASNNLASARI